MGFLSLSPLPQILQPSLRILSVLAWFSYLTWFMTVFYIVRMPLRPPSVQFNPFLVILWLAVTCLLCGYRLYTRSLLPLNGESPDSPVPPDELRISGDENAQLVTPPVPVTLSDGAFAVLVNLQQSRNVVIALMPRGETRGELMTGKVILLN